MNATKWTIVGVTLSVVAYDVFAFISWGVEATISRVVLGWSHQAPILPFGAGVLCGHLFWAQPKPPAEPPKN